MPQWSPGPAVKALSQRLRERDAIVGIGPYSDKDVGTAGASFDQQQRLNMGKVLKVVKGSNRSKGFWGSTVLKRVLRF